MAADVLTVADAIAAHITTGLSSPSEATVQRVYLAPIDLKSITGRQVYVFPATYDDSPANRDEDEKSYSIAVVVLERYTTAGEPSVSWVDTRVNFVNEKIAERCDFVRELLTFATTCELWTESISVVVYDAEMLSEHKTFRSEVVFEFREQVG